LNTGTGVANDFDISRPFAMIHEKSMEYAEYCLHILALAIKNTGHKNNSAL
jgi:hypothetical protein